MRWLYLTIIVLLLAAMLIFALQNFDVVTVTFLGFGIRAPLAVLVAVIYVLGAATGGTVFALLRHLARRSRRRHFSTLS